MRFDKREILEAFDRQERAYRLAILASHWLVGRRQYQPCANDEARSLAMRIGGRWIPFGELAPELEDGARAVVATSEFMLNQLHALVRAPFELLGRYCADYENAAPDAGLIARLRAEPWYWFARAVRNAVSHDLRWDFRGAIGKRLPVTWRGIALMGEMEGQPMSAMTFAHKPGYELFLDMRAFAEALPEVPRASGAEAEGERMEQAR